MRKIIIFTFIVFINSFCFGKVETKNLIKTGFDFEGNFKQESNFQGYKKEQISNSLSVSYERLENIYKFIYLGLGAEYQASRSIKNTNIEFNYIPIYIILRSNIFENSKKELRVFLVAKTGFSFLDGIRNIKVEKDYQAELGETARLSYQGKLYRSFGGGIGYKNIEIEFLYSENDGDIYLGSDNLVGNIKMKSNYSKFSLYLGFCF